MKHFYLFFYLFSLSSGASGIILAILLYLKNKNKDILNYLTVLLLWTANILTYIFQLYLFYIIGYNNEIINIIILILLNLTWSLLSYFLPSLVYYFLKIKFNSIKRMVHILIAIFLMIRFSFFKLNINILNLIEFIQILMFYGILFYMVYVINKSINKIINKDIKNLLKLTVYLQLFFYPLMFIERTPFLLKYFPYGLGFYPAFYFLCNFLWLYFVSRYLYFPEIKIDDNYSDLDNFFKIYSISKREQEITKHLIEGMSYKEIGDKLFISFETVKTHINNIYDKSRVKNKVGLVNLIKKCKL